MHLFWLNKAIEKCCILSLTIMDTLSIVGN